MTGGCVGLGEVLGPHLLKDTLCFEDGLKGDLGRLGLTWTGRSCWGPDECPPSRWALAVWMGGGSLHEERLLREERCLHMERFLRTGWFPWAWTGWFLWARTEWSLGMERPRPLSSPVWLW